MKNVTLQVAERNEKGKNFCRRLRSSGFIPAVIYSHGEAKAIQFSQKEFMNIFKGKNISESIIFNLKYDGEVQEGDADMAFVKDYHADPVSGNLKHVDLYHVHKGEKIKTNVPIEITGTPVGLKLGGILEISEREVEIECLPKDLPETITVDVTALSLDDSIQIQDLELGEEISVLSYPEAVIASVHMVKVKEVEEEVEEGEEDLEGDEEKAEGETDQEEDKD